MAWPPAPMRRMRSIDIGFATEVWESQCWPEAPQCALQTYHRRRRWSSQSGHSCGALNGCFDFVAIHRTVDNVGVSLAKILSNPTFTTGVPKVAASMIPLLEFPIRTSDAASQDRYSSAADAWRDVCPPPDARASNAIERRRCRRRNWAQGP